MAGPFKMKGFSYPGKSPIKQGVSYPTRGEESKSKVTKKQKLTYAALGPYFGIKKFKKDHPEKVEEIKTKAQKFVERGKKYIKEKSKDITLKSVASGAITGMFTRVPIDITKIKK